MKQLLLLPIVFFISFQFAYSQYNEVQLWKEAVRGSKFNISYQEDIAIIDGRVRITHVVTPTLRIYSPLRENTHTAIIIFPGGGYQHLAIEKEGYYIANYFAMHGITAAVLKYRLPNDTIMENKSIGPLQDAQESVRYLRRNAKELNIDVHKIGIMGFSAGGHLASTLSTHYNDVVYDSDSVNCRPDFAGLIYPVITMNAINTNTGSRRNLLPKDASDKDVDYFSNELHVTKDTPPSFLVCAGDDKVVPVQNSLDYYSMLLKNNVAAELHIFKSGGHGFGIDLAKGTTAQWPEMFVAWLKQLSF